MDFTSIIFVAVSAGLAGLIAGIHLWRRRRREGRDTAALAENVEKSLHIPRSLHPVIDTAVCIGSLSCFKACPEGDILGIVDGAARLVHADHCIGHGRCAAECPLGAIKLVMGTAERGVDLPEVDEFFESSRRGVHVVGELGGMGLIRNAIEQGLQVSRRLAASLTPGARGGAADVAIVGAGPAGLATAFGLQAAGLSYRLLEQGTVGGTMSQYPRHKVVMTEPVEIPLYGKIGKRVIAKEKLLASWSKAIARGGIRVEEGVKVEGITGEDGRFLVQTSRGTVAARKVVLATGRRGTPRKLEVPGEELPKVTYSLVDPNQYDSKRVLVVGGGDSALEAAAQLAEESSAQVALSYRGDGFGRAREANRKKVEELARRKRIRTIFSSKVTAVLDGQVALEHTGGPFRMGNDYVLVLIGGELPLEFLKKAGVEMKRYHGEVPAALQRRQRPRETGAKADESRRSRAGMVYTALGLAILALLAARGWSYYSLSSPERLRSPLHKVLKPGGPWGHGVGLVATAFMLSNFLYAARKRWRSLKRLGAIRSWLNFHVFVGFMSPLVIAFHAAFQSRNLLASATTAALVVVVMTGIVGRFIYGMVPSTDGHALELEALASRFERIREGARPMLAESRNPARLEAALALATRKVPGGSLARLLVALPASGLRLRLRLWRVRRLIPDRERFVRFRDSLVRLNRLRFQIAFYNGLRRLLRGWRVFHASLALFLVVAIAVHVLVLLYLGYGWK